MRASAELAARHDVRLHTHLAETLDEEDFALQRFGLRTVDYLDSVGWLGPRTWLAHGIHFNAEEIRRLGEAGTGICHVRVRTCVGLGICPTVELECWRADRPGSRWLGLHDASNMIPEARQALYLQRPALRRRALDHPELALAGPPVARHACSGAATSASWPSASRPTWPCSSSTSCASRQPRPALGAAAVRCRPRRLYGRRRSRVVDGAEGLDLAALIARHRAAASASIAGADAGSAPCLRRPA